MWKSKEFEDIWWCKNQINIRCQSGFGWEYNHCDRYVTVKAEKIQFLKRRIFQKKKISNFWTKDLREIVRNGLLYFLMFWFYDKDNAVSTVEQISDQEFWFWLKRKNIAWISTFLRPQLGYMCRNKVKNDRYTFFEILSLSFCEHEHGNPAEITNLTFVQFLAFFPFDYLAKFIWQSDFMWRNHDFSLLVDCN